MVKIEKNTKKYKKTPPRGSEIIHTTDYVFQGPQNPQIRTYLRGIHERVHESLR